jgi:hypothetical protein
LITQRYTNGTLPSFNEILFNFTDTILLDGDYIAGNGIQFNVLEKMRLQSVLINSYLLLYNNRLCSSSVISQINAHLIFIQRKLLNILILINNSGNLINSDENYLFEWLAHYSQLSDVILTKKPFLNLLKVPLGPPI